MKNLIIIGDGGHSKVVQNIINDTKEYRLIEIWDDTYKNEFTISGVRYREIPNQQLLLNDSTYYFIAIGDNVIRSQIANKLGVPSQNYATIIHPRAIVSEKTVIEPGSLIMANAVIQTHSQIGIHSILNTSCVVEHDTTIGDFVHIAPNATITGNCKIGDYVLMGASSVTIPGLIIGADSVIGAGSVVTRSIPKNKLAYGNPARIIETKQKIL